MDGFWQASFAFETTARVVYALLGLFVFGLVALGLRRLGTGSVPRALVSITPSILATVGVLGTFFGIWIGLRDFDVTAIDASVPALLEGLKTAFVTSLWGLFLSVLFRVLASLAPARSTGTDSAVEALSRLIEEQQLTRESTATGLENVQRAIAGDDDGALVAQLGRLRNELRDKLDAAEAGAGERHERAAAALSGHVERLGVDGERRHVEHMDELREFARHMVENTNKSLIEALQNVIDDFNERLMTQFGENFRELNVAVGRLLEWQTRYRTHVEEAEARLERAVGAIERSGEALKEIERASSAIPSAVEPLAPVLDAIETSLERINADLAAYADLHDKARAALPEVNSNLEAMTTGLREAVESMISRSDEALVRQRDAQSVLEAGYEAVLAQADVAQERFGSAVEATMARVGNELSAASEQMGQELRATLADTDHTLKQQIESLDKALGEELQKALETMGSNLGSMSQQLVDDYGPLTAQLRSLIELAHAANDPARRRTG